MKVNTRSAGYAASLLTLVNVASQIIAFFYRVALVALIGSEVMGLYQLVMPVYSVIMSIVVVGLTVAVSRLSAAELAAGHTARLRQLVATALRLFFTVFLVVAALIALLSDAISVHLLSDARTRLGLLMLLPCIFFTGIENIHKNYFYGIKNVHPPALSEMVEQIVRSTAVLVLVASFKQNSAERTVALIVCGLVVCEIVSATLLRICYRRDMAHRTLSGTGQAPRALRRSIADIAVPVSLSALSLNLIGSANAIIIPERLMVSGLPSSQALSLYGVVFGMVIPLIALPMACVTALTLVMVPRISEAVAKRQPRQVRQYINRSLKTTTLIMVPLLSLLALFGEPIVDALFHNSISAPMMTLLCADFLLTSYQAVTGSVLNAVGKQRRAAANTVVSGLVQLALTWLAVAQPSLRLMGAIWAMLIGTALGTALNALDVRSFTKKAN